MNRLGLESKAYLFCSLAVLFWAGNAIIGKEATHWMHPLLLSYIRWGVASSIVIAICWRQFGEAFNYLKRHPVKSIVLSFLGVTCYNTFLYIAVVSSGSLNITLINTLIPPVTMIVALLLSSAKINRYHLIAISFAIPGSLVIIFKGSIEQLSSLKFVVGDLVMIGAVLIWSTYSVFMKKFSPDISAKALVLLTVILGWIFLSPVLLFPGVLSSYHFEPNHTLTFIYVGLFASVISFFCWNAGIKMVGAPKAAFAMYFMPVFVSIINYVLFQIVPSWYHYVGLFLILSGFIILYKFRNYKQV